MHHFDWALKLRVQSTTGSQGVRINGSNAGYTMFQGSVKSTGYPQRAGFKPQVHQGREVPNP